MPKKLQYFALPLILGAWAASRAPAMNPASAPAPATHPKTTASTASREAYYQRTVIQAYDQVGNTDPRWDQPAHELLKLAVQTWMLPDAVQDHNLDWRITQLGATALDAGCDDPMVAYHFMRAVTRLNLSDDKRVNACARILNDTVRRPDCKYSASFKVYAMTKLADMYDLSSKNPEVKKLVLPMVNFAYKNIAAAFAEDGCPQLELIFMCRDLTNVGARLDGDRIISFKKIDAILRQSLPNSPLPDLFQGLVYTSYAWDARGMGWASSVTEEQSKLEHERLAVVKEALLNALKIDPHLAAASVAMLEQELGAGEGQQEMDKWFQRAIADDPDSYAAYEKKLFYLTPKWYGSIQDQLDFGRACLNTGRWQTRIPFLLLKSHANIYEGLARKIRAADKTPGSWQKAQQQAAAEFYKAMPAAWLDVQKLFTAYLARNPQAVYDRSDYARLAMLAGHPEIAQQQLDILGDKAVYIVFGSPAGLDKFRDAVKEAVSKPTAGTKP